MPVSNQESSWWDRVASELLSVPGLVGRTLSVEELSQMVPRYPSGGTPRGRTVARRLALILELVERGPNGSRGRGAKYRVRNPDAHVPIATVTETPDDELQPDMDWLEQSIRRMTADD